MITLDLSDVIFVNGNSWVLDVLNPTITRPENQNRGHAAGLRIGSDCAPFHNGHPYACPRCDWTSDLDVDGSHS